MNEIKVQILTALLVDHDLEEQDLVDRIRYRKYVPESQWAHHDLLEREILYTMADMTEDEIREADNRYEEEMARDIHGG